MPRQRCTLSKSTLDAYMADEMIPFLMGGDISQSIAFYVDGLGYEVEMEWRPGGELRWCQLRKSGTAIMLQASEEVVAAPEKGRGVRLCVMCDDALKYYRDFLSRGVQAKEPYVGNKLWVTSVTDPDGYHIDFESPTDAPEETRLFATDL